MGLRAGVAAMVRARGDAEDDAYVDLERP